MGNGGTFAGNGGFVGLGVFVCRAVNHALAVANHPHLVSVSAVYYATGRHPFFGMAFEPRQQAFVVVAPDAGGHTVAEPLARQPSVGMAYVLAYQLHAQPPVGHPGHYACGGLAGASVYHGNEVIGCHDTVFCLRLWLFGHDALFYYPHRFVLGCCQAWFRCLGSCSAR